MRGFVLAVLIGGFGLSVDLAEAAAESVTGALVDEDTGKPLGPDTWPALLDFGQMQVLVFLVKDEDIPRPKGTKVPRYLSQDQPTHLYKGDKLRLDILAFGKAKGPIQLSCKADLFIAAVPYVDPINDMAPRHYQGLPAYTCFRGSLPSGGVSVQAGGNPLIYYHNNDPGDIWMLQVDVTDKASGKTLRASATYANFMPVDE